MTEQEAIEKLEEIVNTKDTETAHIDADDLISDFIRANGFEKLADAYDEAASGFWYA
jgi:predicted GNAT family N-acyltransferase